jgi:SAM-dependent methyltransferase
MKNYSSSKQILCSGKSDMNNFVDNHKPMSQVPYLRTGIDIHNTSLTEKKAYPEEQVNADNEFTDAGLWTPQTSMLRAIKRWVNESDFEAKCALSIDKNPTLDTILIPKWPAITIHRAIYPEFDAQNLFKIADNQYDLVYSHQVLEHIAKPWIAAREMVRVLRPGGIGLHTTCAFNPRHGFPQFKDYYRFLPDGLAELFEGVNVLVKEGWGNREALLYNLSIDDGHGPLRGRRFHKEVGKRNDDMYPWCVWIIFTKL